jgi:pimeloyl-ACP methyl ester carboxylesterase
VHGILHGSFPFTDPIFIVSWGAVAHGTLTVAAHFNGFSQESFVYEPNSGYTGDDSFTYHACDSLGQCIDGTITLSVINNPPHAVPDSYTLHGILQHGGDFPVTMNDSDPDHDPIRVVSVTQPSNGTFTYDFLHDSFTYEPRAGFAGTDSVSYTICDSLGLCDSTTITLIVINHPPAANTDNFTMQTNETLFSNGPGVLKNDSDPDNDPFSVSNYTQSAHGHVISLLNDGSLVYEPNQGFIGQDTFNYTVCDYLGACANGVVVIDVQGEAPTPTPTPTPVATPTRTPLPPPPSPTPTPTPTEPLIFIPGIAGSYLVDKTTGAELWPGILTNHDQLSLNPADSPNPNIVATDVIRSVAGTNYYGRLLDVLETRGKYVEYQVSNNPSRRTSSGCDLSQKSGDPTLNPSLFVFAYDWRKSNVENLSTLTDFVGCVQRFFPDQKINILTHSMGSLLARRYILENPGRVKKLITIGGPWLGAPKAIYTLETGDAGFSRLLIWHSTLKRLSEYFKSLHEIIPSESYFDIGQRPFAEVGDFNSNGTPDEKYSYAQLTDLLDRRHGTLPGSNNLAFHSYPGQDNWRFDNSGVEYHHLLGVQHINQTIGRVVASRETVCRRLGFELSCFDRDDFTTSVTHGDRTVPEESATRLGLDDLNARGARLWYYFSLSDRADELVEHTALTELDGLHKRVLFLLGKGPDPGDSDDTVALARPSLEPNLRMDAVNRRASLSEQSVSGKSTAPAETVRANHSKLKRFSPETRVYEGTNTIASTLTEPPRAEGYYVTVRGVDFVSITDEQGNTNTRLDDTFAQPVPNVTYDLIGENAVFVSTPADKTYTIGFQAGTEPINLEIVKGTDNVTPNEARRYRDTALAPGVNAMMRFGLNGIESLRYDADGDGIFETIVGPTATLSGPEAADVNSPSVTITGEAQQTRVLVTINAQDSESGVKTIYYSSDRSRYQPYTGSFLADPSQVTTISAFVDDNAANRSALATYAVPRLPSIMAPPNLGLNTNANETTCGVVVTDDVLGNATAVSNSSGTVTVTRAGVPSNHLFPVGTTTVTYTATDSNGLIATAIQNVTVADKTAPMITCPSRIVAFLPFNSTANSIIVSYPAPSASDNCSASVVTATPSSGSLFPVGTTSAIATASDSAGNAASCSFPVSVLYRFAGFLNPVNNLPTLNAVNAGRAIPIKFSLSGYKGLDIFAASPGSGRIGCSSSTEVELTDTRSAGNSSLSYDHSADLYNYVWKTDKAWAGTCRQFVVQLSDGSIHRANFRLK